MSENPDYPLYGEPHRPQYHFTPPAGFMNDPCGLVYWNGWQLCYQYNPFNMKAGYPSWGHACSRDLLHWQNLPIAIPNSPEAQIFTGSVIVDTDNTSGFFSVAGLVAVYTLSKPQKEVQEIAYSVNGGVTFTKYEQNPVLDLDYPELSGSQSVLACPNRPLGDGGGSSASSSDSLSCIARPQRVEAFESLWAGRH
jgi:sucrose-6-phosphate hydrolase SacC (GH32 family)